MASIKAGDILDGTYRLKEEVGRGSMGIVYRADDEPQSRQVAVKVMKGAAAADERLRRLFRREARAMARLNHPGIIEIYGVGLAGDRPYLAMEWVEGAPLNKLPNLPSSLETVVTLMDRLLEALAHAHARGVIHRDLKPANILLEIGEGGVEAPVERGTVKIVDFGIARVFESRAAIAPRKGGRMTFAELGRQGFNPETHPYEVRLEGTPHYMAPELYKGRDGMISPANDIYALGVILYELLTGKRVFDADSEMVLMALQLKGEIAMARTRPELGLITPPTTLLRRMLDPDPIKRIDHASDVRRLLMAWFQAQDTPTLTDSLVPASLSASTPWQSSDPAQETRAAPSNTAARTVPEVNLLAWRPVPVVGRASAQAWLWQQLEAVLTSSTGAVVLAEGERGIGKTHLARWLTETAAEAGTVQPLWCTLGSRDLVTAMRAVLGRHFGTEGLEGEHLNRRLSEQLTYYRRLDASQTALALGEEVSFFESLLAPEPEDNPEDSQEFDPSTTMRGVLGGGILSESSEALATLLSRALRLASRRRPVLLVLDGMEVRHLDGAIALVERVIRSQYADPFPVLIVITAVSEVFGKLSESASRGMDFLVGAGHLQRMVVRPLEPLDVMTILTRYQSFDAEMRRSILMRAQGNPLFATELAAHALRQAEGGENISDMPEGIAGLWRGRIDEIAAGSVLGTTAIRILELCAILGAPVWMDLLNTAWNAPSMADFNHTGEEIPLAWDLWVDQNILVEDGSGVLSFRYGLLRDTLLADLAGSERARNFHKAASWARRQLDLVRTPEDWLKLAHHLIQARKLDEAWIFALGAAQTMLTRGDLRAAQNAFLRCEDILTQQGAGLGDERRELVDVGLAQIAWRLGNPGEARRRARVLCKRGGRIGSIRQLGMGELLLAELALRDAAPHESEKLFDRALARFETSEDTVGQAEALMGLGRLALRGGRAEVAGRHVRNAIGLLGAFPGSEALGRARLLAGEVERDMGDIEDAVEHFNAARGIFETVGDRMGLGRAVSELGQIAQARGQVAQAAAMFTDFLEQAEALGDIPAMAQAMANLGLAKVQLGELEPAVEMLESARRAMDKLNDQSALAIIEAILSLALARLGRWAEASGMVSVSLDTIERLELYDIDLAETLEALAWEPRARQGLGDDYTLVAREAARQWRNLGYVERAHRVSRRAGV